MQAPSCYNEFLSLIKLVEGFPKDDTTSGMVSGSAVGTRSRSRSPPPKLQGSNIREANGVRNCQYVGNRIARKFNGLIYFGTVTEKMGGAVLARQPDGSTLWQSVWKVVYDDQDAEELNRLELIDGLKLYRSNEKNDLCKPQAVIESFDDDIDMEEDAFTDHGFPSSESDYLDPQYRLLDLLTPNATQNRLSYLVELLIDKSKKQISNEAVKERLRKDAAAFGASDMPSDVRAIGRFLGARSLNEVTRHRCGGDDCSYAWIGAVDKDKFNSNDVCPECGHPRYVLDRGKLKPVRVFYYFGASYAIEALHRNQVFKSNWKKNTDISLNAYRSSRDAARLNKATNHQALADGNGLYISMADGFQSHLSKTQSVTGWATMFSVVSNLYCLCFLLYTLMISILPLCCSPQPLVWHLWI